MTLWESLGEPVRAQGRRKLNSAGHMQLEVWVTLQGRGGGRGAALGLETQLRGQCSGSCSWGG